ncbi:hypothetical protein [Lunatimonas salinarum]|uniref:hypothetical protein n=1 Tax=Lunatimonas salinarum TaxID=1774590 RepID=UPI001AE03497|nr:hypothetical protein [Lunatimonas salinarum]
MENVYCLPQGDMLTSRLFGEGNMDLNLWEAQRFSDVLQTFIKLPVEITKG